MKKGKGSKIARYIAEDLARQKEVIEEAKKRKRFAKKVGDRYAEGRKRREES